MIKDKISSETNVEIHKDCTLTHIFLLLPDTYTLEKSYKYECIWHHLIQFNTHTHIYTYTHHTEEK